jgi:hypothetical protein
MATIGAVVFSLQGSRSLEECLRSLAWADAIMILHLGAGDPALPKGLLPDRVARAASIEEIDRRFREMKIDWILHLWGGERLDERLRDELASFRMESRSSHREYRVEVRSKLLNRWVRGSLWGPTPSPRLRSGLLDLSLEWRQGAGRAESRAPLLSGCIEDTSAEELRDGLDRLNRFSTLSAERSARDGVRPRGGRLILDSFRAGARLLAMNGVYAGGVAGVTFSLLAGYTVLLGGAKLWEKGIETKSAAAIGRDD